jgi:nuclease S1
MPLLQCEYDSARPNHIASLSMGQQRPRDHRRYRRDPAKRYRTQTDQRTPSQGTTLADASTWPDKAGRQIPDMDPYHFINFPKDANTYDQQRDCKLRNCIIEAIAWYTPVLKAPDAPRNEKRIAVRFVAHLVGDIHQPLHAGVAEDRGGNSIDVRFNGRKENLHSLWDTALIELEQGTPADIATRIQAMVSSDELQQRQQGTTADWALESLAIIDRINDYFAPRKPRLNN